MDTEQDELEFFFEEDDAEVLNDFVKYMASKGLLFYKSIVHTGGKTGESLWTHIMNLVMVAEKLRPLFELEPLEMCCLLVALVVHDLNKLPEYGERPDGKSLRYAQAALPEKIMDELEKRNVGLFFRDWKKYDKDIKYLVDSHQEKTMLDSQHDQRLLDECVLKQRRLKGPLAYLMKAADVSDNSHSGDYSTSDESHIRNKLIRHVNTALSKAALPLRYRMVGYRLAEFRGLQTNIIHNQMIALLRTTYGEKACIDLLYHADGTDFLLDQRLVFSWDMQMQQQLARAIAAKFAALQAEKLAQFIKAHPWGIAVASAAAESGASLRDIFQTIVGVVDRKQYNSEKLEERRLAVQADLKKFLDQGQTENPEAVAQRQRVQAWLAEATLLPTDREQLKRGEFLSAYRNFLNDHRAQECRALKQDAWHRVARLFHLPEAHDSLYALINTYRRGYVMARELPVVSLDAMMEAALEDLEQLDAQAKTKIVSRNRTQAPVKEGELADVQAETTLDVEALEDYLARNLQVWDDEANISTVKPVAFHETLQRYVQDANPEHQCCYCGSSLKADAWMAAQVPSSIGVQSFSNRLDGGSSREPKRNVCAICRNQFILEKLAWSAHKDKQGKDEVTFYLHLFSYSFLTRPLLDAWWQSIERFRDGDYKALFLKTKEYFGHWEKAYHGFQAPIVVTSQGISGLGIPTFPEAISNTPVLPLNIPGDNYGCQFLLALEKTIMLANWFDCRVLLSRLPTPLLNLEHERLRKGDDDKASEPVAFLVESVPQSMNWLLPQNACTRKQVEGLCEQLSLLHQITALVAPPDEVAEVVIYRLVTAAARDPLALYYEVDHQIERTLTRQKGGNTELRALNLSARVAPLVEKLLLLKENEEGIHV